MGAFVGRQFGSEALNANAETEKSLKVPLRWVIDVCATRLPGLRAGYCPMS